MTARVDVEPDVNAPVEPSAGELRRAARAEARQARADAKAARKAEKAAAKEQARADDEAAAEEARADSEAALDLTRSEGELPSDEAGFIESTDSQMGDEPGPEPMEAALLAVHEAETEREQTEADEARVAEEARVADEQRRHDEAKAEAKRLKAAEKAQAKRDKAEAKAEARRAQDEARRSQDAVDDDGIVEPPRAPRQSLLGRHRGDDGTDGGKSSVGRNAFAVVVGVLGLLASIVLAVGAMFVALGSESGQAFDTLSSVCDFLVGPLRDVFSFSGAKADSKEALVAWGLGSMAYLAIGLIAQSFARSESDD